MSQRNTVIFPFPAVQYIPLAITNLTAGPIPRIKQTKPVMKLIAGPELESCQVALNHDYGIAIPNDLPSGTCPICAINMQITEVKYRGFFVTMLGKEDQGNYQLFTIPSALFYKSKLYFQVFEPVSAKQLASCSLFMPMAKQFQVQ